MYVLNFFVVLLCVCVYVCVCVCVCVCLFVVCMRVCMCVVCVCTFVCVCVMCDNSLPKNVQADAIPLILGGCDVMIAAETGSGKTGAFVIPVLQLISECLQTRTKASTKKEVKRCDVMCPCTDLCCFYVCFVD